MLLLFAVLELSARLYWNLKYGVPVLKPQDIAYQFYPDVGALLNSNEFSPPKRREVLVLGGSVIDEMRPDFEAFSRRLREPTRFHIAARVAHTSLDSIRKYRQLESLPFDDVLLYEGINDCKYNNAPDDLFDAEYSAYPYYKSTAALEYHRELGWLAFPFTLEFAWVQFSQGKVNTWTAPTVYAQPKWYTYGSTVKTAVTYRRNIEEIVKRAKGHGSTVILSTFASYIPDNYTEEKFRSRSLDYTQPYHLPAKIWGRADDVRNCVGVHNEIMRDISAKSGLQLLDFEKSIPKSGANFVDPCHLSPDGRKLFFDLLAKNL